MRIVKEITNKEVKELQAHIKLLKANWYEGINDKEMEYVFQFLKKYADEGSIKYWKKVDSYIVACHKGTYCISRNYWDQYYYGEKDYKNNKNLKCTCPTLLQPGRKDILCPRHGKVEFTL